MEFGNIKSKELHVKAVTEQKFSQIDGITGSVEDSWGKVKNTLMDILINDLETGVKEHFRNINSGEIKISSSSNCMERKNALYRIPVLKNKN